jgi:hypothetical protein
VESKKSSSWKLRVERWLPGAEKVREGKGWEEVDGWILSYS